MQQAEVALGMGAAMEKLKGAENVYDVVRCQALHLAVDANVSCDFMKAKKMTTDLTRARLAVQNSHSYFTRALKICDNVRGGSMSRVIIGGFGGGLSDASKMIEYKRVCFPEFHMTMHTFALMCRHRICNPGEQSPDLLE